jgi:hypothetical protein
MNSTFFKLLILITGTQIITLCAGSSDKDGNSLKSSAVVGAASKQTTQPAPQPAKNRPSKQSGQRVPNFQPLRDAKAGEWVRYEAKDSMEINYRIQRVRPSGVTTMVRTLLNGYQLGLPAYRQDVLDLDPLAAMAVSQNPQRTMKRVTVKAAEKFWKTRLYEDHWREEKIDYRRRTWVSPEVPVFGILRMELYGNDRLESRMILRDCGLVLPNKTQLGS